MTGLPHDPISSHTSSYPDSARESRLRVSDECSDAQSEPENEQGGVLAANPGDALFRQDVLSNGCDRVWPLPFESNQSGRDLIPVVPDPLLLGVHLAFPVRN